MYVIPWVRFSKDEIAEQAIRKELSFSAGYRFFPNRYEANVSFCGEVSREALIFVLEGGCTYVRSQQSLTVVRGQVLVMSPGHYRFEAGDNGVTLVRVYFIPELREDAPSQ